MSTATTGPGVTGPADTGRPVIGRVTADDVLTELLVTTRPAGWARPDAGVVLVVLGAIGLLVPLLGGVRPALLAVGGVLAVGVAATAVFVPEVALLILVLGEFSGVSTVLVERGLPGIYTPTLGLGVLSVLVALRRPEVRARLRRPPLAPAALLGIYLLAIVPATLVTVSPFDTAVDNERLVKECVFLVVLLLLAHIGGRPWRLAAAITVPLAVIAFLSVVNQVALGSVATFGGFATVSEATGYLVETERHAGPVLDPNFWGQYLVLGLPFACALLHRAVAARHRTLLVCWATATAMIVAGIYLTGSRGALIAGLAACGLWALACGPGMRRSAVRMLPVVGLVMLIPGVGNRLVNLGEAFEDVPAYTVDPSLVERSAAQTIAWRMFVDRPTFGSGPATFETQIHEYASRSPDILIGTTEAAHNTFLGIAAETGAVGLLGWLVFLAGMAVVGVRGVLLLAGHPQYEPSGAPTRPLAAAALAAVVGWSITSVFLHLALIRPMFVVCALAGVLVVTARDSERGRSAAAARATARARQALRAGLARGSAVVGVAVLAGGLTLVALADRQYTAETKYTLVPAPGVFESYALDVRSRTLVLPAYAAMIQADIRRADVRSDAEPATGLLTFAATSATTEEARSRLAEFLVRAPRTLASFGANRQYVLREVSPVELAAQRVYGATTIGTALLAALVASGALVLGSRVRRAMGTR